MHNFLLHGGHTVQVASFRENWGHFPPLPPDTVLADSDHVEVLRRRPRSWNNWRRQNPAMVPNLIRLSLSAAERQMGIMKWRPSQPRLGTAARPIAALRHAFRREPRRRRPFR